MAHEPLEPESDGTPKTVIVKRILLLVIVAYLIAFLVDNRNDVNVSFVFFHSNTSLIIALLVSGVLGFISGWAISTMRRRSRRRD